MKLKEKFQRFWTLSGSRQGFTLVELIVVIAILAILAGVAIPVYNGYIKKAQTAADQTLLDTINTSFAAACLENGISQYDITNVYLPVNSDGTVGALSSVKVGNAVITGKMNESFAFYFAGNENAAFNTFKSLPYDTTAGMFVGSEVANAYASLADAIMSNNPAGVTALKNSIFMNDEAGLGTDGLLNKVNDVASFAALAGNSAMSTIFTSSDFQNYAAGVLGVDSSDPNFQTLMNDKMNSLTAEMMAQNPGMTQEQATAQVQANAAVLYAANNTASMSYADVQSLLGSDGAKGTISGNLSSNTGTALSQAAVAYGMYTAYAYSTGDQTLIDNTSDPLKILNGLDDDGFQAYINDANNKADVEGYLAAMSMVNSSSGDMDAVSQLMVNGFDDPELAAVLAQLAGK